MARHGGAREGPKDKRGRKPAPGESFEAARRRKERALADLREIEVGIKRGALLEVERVEREWGDTLRAIRARVLAVGSRLRQRLPHLTPHDVVVIDRELRDALAASADGDDASEAGVPDAPGRGGRHPVAA